MIGILLGIVLGVGIITAFVFLGSEDTIDAPRIPDGQGRGAQEAPASPGAGEEPGRP